MNKYYEIRQFSEVPKELRDKLRDLTGEPVNLNDKVVQKHSRVIIEVSSNPGTTPYILKPDEQFYDFFSMKCREAGTTSNELSKKLGKQFSLE